MRPPPQTSLWVAYFDARGKVSEQRFGKASLGVGALVAGKAGSRQAELLGSTVRLAQSVGRRALNLVVVGSNFTLGVLPIVGFAGALPNELHVVMHPDGDVIMEHVGEA